jgi:ABC-type polysaccharide/polyol phosphate export permease
VYFRAPLQASELAWFPVVVLVQLVMSVGFALILSALTVHFRDIKDILVNVMTLWFFATPIIYRWDNPPPQIRRFLNLNPFSHIAISYQEILYFTGPFGNARWILALGIGSVLLFLFGYFLFDRLRDSFAEEV